MVAYYADVMMEFDVYMILNSIMWYSKKLKFIMEKLLAYYLLLKINLLVALGIKQLKYGNIK